MEEFVQYVYERLVATDNPGYRWPFHVHVAADWLPAHMHQGTTFAQTAAVLDLAGGHLATSLAANDGQGVFEAVAVIMDWGGVWNAGVVNNMKAVLALHEAGGLTQLVLTNLDALQAGNLHLVTRMNSGWSKVYAVALPAHVIMYDSRVSFCLVRWMDAWSNQDPARLHLRANLRQVAARGNRRHVVGYPRLYAPAHPRTVATRTASTIVDGVLAHANQAPAGAQPWFYGYTRRQVEAALFMLGA